VYAKKPRYCGASLRYLLWAGPNDMGLTPLFPICPASLFLPLIFQRFFYEVPPPGALMHKFLIFNVLRGSIDCKIFIQRVLRLKYSK
jgi:hypothetical protein